MFIKNSLSKILFTFIKKSLTFIVLFAMIFPLIPRDFAFAAAISVSATATSVSTNSVTMNVALDCQGWSHYIITRNVYEETPIGSWKNFTSDGVYENDSEPNGPSNVTFTDTFNPTPSDARRYDFTVSYYLQCGEKERKTVYRTAGEPEEVFQFTTKESKRINVTVAKPLTTDQSAIQFDSYWNKYPNEWHLVRTNRLIVNGVLQIVAEGSYDDGNDGGEPFGRYENQLWGGETCDDTVYTYYRENNVNFVTSGGLRTASNSINISVNGSTDTVESGDPSCGSKSRLTGTVIVPLGGVATGTVSINANITNPSADPVSSVVDWTCKSNATRYTISRNDTGIFINTSGQNGTTTQNIAKKTNTETYIYTLNCYDSSNANVGTASANVTVDKKSECPPGQVKDASGNCVTNSDPISVTPGPQQIISVGNNMTITWTTDGNSCTVGNADNSYIYTTVTGTGSKSYTFVATNPDHAFLNSSHLANNTPSNILGFVITCKDTTDTSRAPAQTLDTAQVYTPVNTLITGPDVDGNLTATCSPDFDYLSLKRDGVELAGPATYGGTNQTVQRSFVVTNPANGTYTLNCKSVGIATNTKTSTKVYAAVTVTGSITGNKGGTPTAALENNGKFQTLNYQVTNADSIRIKQEVRDLAGTYTLDTADAPPNRPNAKYIPTSANGYTINLSTSDSPVIERGMTWTIEATQGGYTKTLALSIDSSTLEAQIINFTVAPGGGGADEVFINFVCKNTVRYELYNDDLASPLIDSGLTGTMGTFTKKVTYTLTSSSPSKKIVPLRIVCYGVLGQKEDVRPTEIPSRKGPRLVNFRIYPEQIICSPKSIDSRKISIEYSVENPKGCGLQSESIQATTTKPGDSEATIQEKNRRAEANSYTQTQLNAVSIPDGDGVTRTGIVKNILIKYSTKLKMVCTDPVTSLPGIASIKSIEAVCQGEN